jgi:hypothetical protein
VDGARPNAIGFVVLIGGILVLRVAFVLNLLPLVGRIGPERPTPLWPLNLLVGAFLLFFLASDLGRVHPRRDRLPRRRPQLRLTRSPGTIVHQAGPPARRRCQHQSPSPVRGGCCRRRS